jgi:hypothetical protein
MPKSSGWSTIRRLVVGGPRGGEIVHRLHFPYPGAFQIRRNNGRGQVMLPPVALPDEMRRRVAGNPSPFIHLHSIT